MVDVWGQVEIPPSLTSPNRVGLWWSHFFQKPGRSLFPWLHCWSLSALEGLFSPPSWVHYGLRLSRDGRQETISPQQRAQAQNEVWEKESGHLQPALLQERGKCSLTYSIE